MTHPNLTPLSSNTCNHLWKTSSLPSGPVSWTGSTMTTSSHIKDVSMFCQRTPSIVPSSPNVTTMKLLVTLVTSKLTSMSSWSSGWVLYNLCASTSKAVPCVSKTSSTHTSSFSHSPQSSVMHLTLSNRSPVTLSLISLPPLVSIHYWSWLTMVL